MPAALAPFMPWILGGLGTLLAGLAARGLHHAASIAKTKDSDLKDQAKLDDLEHLLDTAVDSTVPEALSDVAAGQWGKLVSLATAKFETLASSQFLDGLGVVVKVSAGALGDYLKARLAAKMAAHPLVSAAQGKTLLLPVGASAGLSLDERRALLATQGVPAT